MTQPTDDRAAPSGLLDRAFVVLCLVCFLNHFVTAPFPSLFPVYVEAELQRLPWFTGYLRGTMLVLGGAFAVVGGQLCDVIGRKATLLIGLAGALLTGLVFRTTSPALLSVLIVGMGIGMGPWSTAGQSYLIASVSAARLGLGGALYFLSNTAGNSLGSLAFGLVKERLSFAQVGAAMVAALVVVFALAVVLLPGDRGERRSAPRQVQWGLWSAYRPFLRQPNVHLLVALRFSITSFWGMATLLMPLLVYRVSDSQAMPLYYASVSLAVAAACQLSTGFLSDRCGRLWPLMIAAGGIAASAVALGLLWRSLPMLFVFGTTLTGTAWAVSTLVPKLISEVAVPAEKNRLVGLLHMVWSAAMLTGSIAGGYLVEIDPSVPFAIGAVLAAAGATCGWRLCRRLETADA